MTEAELLEGRPSPGYPALMDEMIDAAEFAFREGFDGLEHLPRTVRMPVSVAVHVYRGLLGEIRRNGYDYLSHRAELSLPRMVGLAGRAMFEAATSSLHRMTSAPPIRLPLH